ncbi:MAG: AlkZ family DNA glycosylase [Nitrososphaerota archaeon]|nr:AlkZ family DNA glycosylase [Nitrososphaerota archaeon]
MAGAQAQVLSAAQLSIWARSKACRVQDLDSAIWKKKTLVRAWAMRRTMFLLPSGELALFARGTAKRPEYNYRWALARVSSKQQLDRALDGVVDILSEPRSRNEIARLLQGRGYTMKLKAGGGWGDSRAVPWVEVGGKLIPVGFLLHAVAARDVICSGPNVGNESTYVRADRWVPKWRDVPQERAEEELLIRYLKAFGPATMADFALWMGLYMRDVKEMWAGAAGKVAEVEIEGWKAAVLESDLTELEKAKIESPTVKLLPNFDGFLLGHKSHRNIVDARNHKKVYRDQGWVSPVVLVDGRAVGVWSYKRVKEQLEVNVAPFARLHGAVAAKVREEAAGLGEFLGLSTVKTVV